MCTDLHFNKICLLRHNKPEGDLMSRWIERGAIFILGGAGYGILELMWRGRTHWTMLLTGGVCMQILYLLAGSCPWPRWQKYLAAGLCITTIEYCVGLLVNVYLGWAVWDYSDRRLHLLGQICPLYAILWTVLSVPVLHLCSHIQKKLHR